MVLWSLSLSRFGVRACRLCVCAPALGGYWKGASPEVVKLGEEERGLKTRRWVVFPSVVLVRSLACGFLSLTL